MSHMEMPMNKNKPCLMDIFEELLLKAENKNSPEGSKYFESNEFFYEKINPNISWQTPLSTSISKLALRVFIEMAYAEGKKEGIMDAQTKVIEWIDDREKEG